MLTAVSILVDYDKLWWDFFWQTTQPTVYGNGDLVGEEEEEYDSHVPEPV